MLGKVIKNSFWYSFSSVLLRASSIIFFPIFSKYLTKADYGILSVTQSIIIWVSAVAALELHSTFVRFLNSVEANDELYRSKVIGNIILFSCFSFSVIILILLFFGQYILKTILNDIDFYPYMFYSIVGLFFSFIVNLYRFYLKASQKGKQSFWFDILFFSSNIILNLVFVVLLKTDVIGIIYSTIICGVIFSSKAFFQFTKEAKFSFDKKILKSLLNYSLPLVSFILLGMGIETTSTFFLNKEIGKEATGIFYIAVTFAAIFSTVKESIIAAITPWFFEYYGKRMDLIYKLINHLIIGGAILCFGISVFSYEVLSILSSNPNLVVSWKYIPILLIGYYTVFVGQIYNLPIYQQKNKNNRLIIGSLVGFLATFMFCYFYAQHGIIAAVISKTIGYGLMTVVFLYIASLLKFKVNYIGIVLTMLIFVPMFFINFLPLDYKLLLPLKILMSVIVIWYLTNSILKSYIGVKKKYILLNRVVRNKFFKP